MKIEQKPKVEKEKKKNLFDDEEEDDIFKPKPKK
jgi:hypothetical protein